MTRIDDYFLKFADKLSYIELKESSEKYRKLGLDQVSLPIVTDEMMTNILNQDFANQVDLDYIAEGMLINISADPDFKFALDYFHILKNLIDDPAAYAVNKGLFELEKDLDKAILFFRAAYILDPKNIYAAYNYARLLWRVDLEDKEDFVKEAIGILEDIINDDEKFPMSYYELGIINQATGNYMKSLNFYNKTLRLVDRPELKEEIRESISQVEPSALVEDAIYYINKMDYSRAIERLVEASKNNSGYDIDYYLAVSYMNLGYLDMAERHMDDALKKGADFATLYIDFIYIKYSLGKIEEALVIASQALDKYPADIKIRYNRAMIYIELNQIQKANEDFDFILEYQDLSDELFNQIMIIKENINNN